MSVMLWKGGLRYVLKADTRPTPKPAKKRPAVKRGMEVAAVCMITPALKTQQETMSDQRRPSRSAMTAAPRAPKKVPADRIETIWDDWLDVTSRSPWSFIYPVEKRFIQYLSHVSNSLRQWRREHTP